MISWYFYMKNSASVSTLQMANSNINKITNNNKITSVITENKNQNYNTDVLDKSSFLNTNANFSLPPDWQTIQRDTYNYQISFPSDWFWMKKGDTNDPVTDISMSPLQCVIQGDCPGQPSVTLWIVSVEDRGCVSAEDCADKMPGAPTCRESSERNSVKISGIDAVEQFEYNQDGCPTESVYSKTVYWIKDGEVYTLSGWAATKEMFNSIADIFDQIKNSISFY